MRAKISRSVCTSSYVAITTPEQGSLSTDPRATPLHGGRNVSLITHPYSTTGIARWEDCQPEETFVEASTFDRPIKTIPAGAYQFPLPEAEKGTGEFTVNMPLTGHGKPVAVEAVHYNEGRDGEYRDTIGVDTGTGATHVYSFAQPTKDQHCIIKVGGKTVYDSRQSQTSIAKAESGESAVAKAPAIARGIKVYCQGEED